MNWKPISLSILKISYETNATWDMSDTNGNPRICPSAKNQTFHNQKKKKKNTAAMTPTIINRKRRSSRTTAPISIWQSLCLFRNVESDGKRERIRIQFLFLTTILVDELLTFLYKATISKENFYS